MTYRSTLSGARTSVSAVGHATAVTLGASGMDTGHTWVDLETAPVQRASGGGSVGAWQALRGLFRP